MAADEELILEEALDNLQEAAQRIRATQNRMRAAGLQDHPNFRELSTRLRPLLWNESDQELGEAT